MAHTHYKGTGKVHSFRGLLADGEQRKIRIQGSVGAIAWRITKLEIIPYGPGSGDMELVVKIYRESQSSITSQIDFGDEDLLGAAYWSGSSAPAYSSHAQMVFDNTLFSRNIFVTGKDEATGESVNYYIELEEVKISAAGMAQLAVAAARRTID